MRKSLQKALVNKRPQKQFQGSGEVTNYEPGSNQALRSIAKAPRSRRSKIIEDTFGHMPIR